eukprot:scaffold26137_cov80-Skeletonema_marinoi.AAC.1
MKSKASVLSVALIAGLATVNAAEPLEKDFKYKDALKYYHTETAALLKQSLLSAGFAIDETNEVDDIYLDFASRALNAEKERIERIRDALVSQTCSEGDGQCTPPPAKKKIDKSKYSPGFGHFLTHDLEPGQAELMRWEHDGSIVQDYAVRVGLPPDLVPTIKAYVKDMGLLDIMTNMLYDDPLSPGDAKWFNFQSPYQKQSLAEGSSTDELRNFTWNVERPDKKWKSDMHWFNTADELSHEEGLRVLAKGGFDKVLADWEDVDGRAFNFLVGIESPDQAGPELIVEGDFKGEIYYGSNAGILVGDGTRHGTRECDHRAYRGVRIACSIYLSDVTKDNLETLAGDTTSIFPPTGKTAADW